MGRRYMRKEQKEMGKGYEWELESDTRESGESEIDREPVGHIFFFVQIGNNLLVTIQRQTSSCQGNLDEQIRSGEHSRNCYNY